MKLRSQGRPGSRHGSRASENDVPGKRLTAAQKRIAEQAMWVVKPAIAGFQSRCPRLRHAARLCDMESIAHLAICKAAATYDPKKGCISTYFGTAIHRALVKAVDRQDRRSQQEIPEANGIASLGMWARHAGSRGAQDRRHGEQGRELMSALHRLRPWERHLIEDRVITGLSIGALARQHGVTPRTMASRIRKILEKLRDLGDDTAVPPV